MRVRIKFTKNELVKYLGHLDIMRTFQRCFNRADVRMTYSEGFNPHQKMHFALPLGVGIASQGEYLDADIADGQDLDGIRERLDDACGDGFHILAVRALTDNAEKGMASVRYASYEITFDDVPELSAGDYLARDAILIAKHSKTGTKEVDVRPMLLKLYFDGNILHILMKAGSESNIKPELIVQDMMEWNNLPYQRDSIRITRTELYAKELTPLIEYQTI